MTLPSVCRKSPKKQMSLRTSPQAGVAIPPIEGEILDYQLKMFGNSGDSHASVRTGSE